MPKRKGPPGKAFKKGTVPDRKGAFIPPPPEDKTPYSVKQQLFVKEYLIDKNAKQAAIRAGYSVKSAGDIGHQLLDKPLVKKHIGEALQKLETKMEITAERVLNEMAYLAFGRLDKFAKVDGTELRMDFSESTPGDRAAISQLEQKVYMDGRGDSAERVKETKIKMHDKQRALESLGRHLNLFDGKLPEDATAQADKLRSLLRGMDQADQELTPLQQKVRDMTVKCTNCGQTKADSRTQKSPCASDPDECGQHQYV